MIYTVWGSGGVGGTVGAHLAQAGASVRFVDADRARVDTIRDRGLTVLTPTGSIHVSADAFLPTELRAPLGTVLLAVPGWETQVALGDIAPKLGGDDFVLSLQNGLADRFVAAAVGEERTVGAFVNLLADHRIPGRIHMGRIDEIRIGELDGRVSDRVKRVVTDLVAMGDVRASRNVRGFSWGRLGYTAMLYATALVDAPAAETVDRHKELMVEIAAEIYKVAHAWGVPPEPFNVMNPALYGAPGRRDPEKVRENLSAVVAWMRRSERTRADAWRALQSERRRTDVDVEIAMVAEIGQEMRMATPMIDALVNMIREMEDGRRQVGDENLAQLDAVRRQGSREV